MKNLEQINEERKGQRFIPNIRELIIFGLGSTLGAIDGIRYDQAPSDLDFHFKGLPFSGTATLVSYGISQDFKNCAKLGAICQISYLVGRSLTYTIKNNFY